MNLFLLKSTKIKHRVKRVFYAGFVAGSSYLGSMAPALSSSNPCYQAIQKYSASMNVPLNVFYGISKTESNFHPWAINVHGKSVFNANRRQTISYVRSLIEKEIYSFDVGCMQMNVKWHHTRFRSIDELVDPWHNVYQSGLFLLELKREFGSWPRAVSAYHNRNPSIGNAYLEQVLANLARSEVK